MAPPGVGGISALIGGALIVGCFVAAFGGAHLAVLMKTPAADLTPKTRCVGSQRIGACHRLGPAHAESPWMGDIPTSRRTFQFSATRCLPVHQHSHRPPYPSSQTPVLPMHYSQMPPTTTPFLDHTYPRYNRSYSNATTLLLSYPPALLLSAGLQRQ